MAHHVKGHMRTVRRRSKLAKKMPGGPTYKEVFVKGHSSR